MSDFNPNRIVLARRLEGISQKELSASTGISQAKLSKLQNGISVLDKRDAMRLSSALDYPISFFERRDEILPLSSLTYRKTSKSTMAELSAVSSEYSLLASAVQHVASRLNLAGRTSGFAQIAPRTHGNLSEHAIDELADAARSNLGLPATGAVPNVTRTLERSGIIVAPMRSLGFGSEAHLTSEGVTDPSPGRMYCVGYLGSGELSGTGFDSQKPTNLAISCCTDTANPTRPNNWNAKRTCSRPPFSSPGRTPNEYSRRACRCATSCR